MNETKAEKRRKQVRSMARCRAKIKYGLTESDIRRIIREELAIWRANQPSSNNS